MRFLNLILILFFDFIYPLSDENIINNPIESKLSSNPIDYIIIVESEILGNKTNILKYHDYYLITKNLFLIKDRFNNLFLFVNDRLFSLSQQNNEYIFQFIKIISPQLNYYGFISFDYCDDYNSNFYQSNISEVGIYANIANELIINYLSEEEIIDIDFQNSDEYISCKSYNGNVYICSFSQDGIINIKILEYLQENPLEEKVTKEIKIGRFQNHDNAILYDTNLYNKKIICARKKKSNEIECASFEIYLNNNIKDNFYEILIDYNINYTVYYSYEKDNCNFTEFNEEYLLCCGSIDFIKCERRDMDDFYLINNFIINLEGAIRNITIQNTDRERIKLIYYNSNKGQINEYFIVPPKCLDINLDIYTDNKIIEIDLNEYFERRTNTNYYISFNNIFSEFVKIKLNNKDIESINTFEKLNPDENILKFILEKYLRTNII